MQPVTDWALGTPRGRAITGAALAVLVFALGVAFFGDGSDEPEGPSSAEQRAALAEGLPDEVAELLAEMPPERKVAQLMLVGLEGTETDDPALSSFDERDYAGLVIEDRNYVSPDQVQSLAEAAEGAADGAGHVPPWVMAPQEGGEFNALEDLPPDRAAAELANPREAAGEAEAAAAALSETGITGVLAPAIDVGTEFGGAFGKRLFSDDPELVSRYATATLRAYRDAGMFAAPKHFPGLGGASQSPEFGPASVGLSLGQLAARDLIPFEAAIEEGAPGIVIGHGLYGVEDFVTPASMSETIVTELLREDLGFEGVAIADDITSPAVTASFRAPAAAVDSIRAGADMVYVSRDEEQQRAVFDALVEAVERAEISEARLDQAVIRTLLAKREAGLLEGGGGRER